MCTVMWKLTVVTYLLDVVSGLFVCTSLFFSLHISCTEISVNPRPVKDRQRRVAADMRYSRLFEHHHLLLKIHYIHYMFR